MKEQLTQKLIKAFDPLVLTVVDESHQHVGHGGHRPGTPTHFHITLVSERFCGLSPMERHRMVYTLLKEEMTDIHAHIHALALTLRAPEEA